MAYGFNDDKSMFNIGAALSSTQAAAVAESRSIEAAKEFSSLQDFKSWALALPTGQYAITCPNATSQAFGLPWTTYSLIRIYKATATSITIYAQNISRAAVQYGLECCLSYNGAWGDWTRLFDDILPGDVVSFDTNIGWLGRALDRKTLRTLVTPGRRIRANAVTASGGVFIVCGGVGQSVTLNDRPVPGVEDIYYNTVSCGFEKKANSVIVRVDFDYNTNLINTNQLLWFQNDTSVTNKFTLTFS